MTQSIGGAWIRHTAAYAPCSTVESARAVFLTTV